MFFCCKINRVVGAAVILLLIVGVSISLLVASFNAVVTSVVPQNQEEQGVFVPIIMYHSILKKPDRQGDYVLSPDVFESDMRYLSENGYTTVFVSDLIEYVDNDVPLPEKPVVVTFDDGFYNNVTYCLPIIKELDLKVDINVVGNYIQKYSESNEHNPAYSYLTWKDISELVDSGHVEIGNHSYDLHSMNGRRGSSKIYGESNDEYKKLLNDDVGLLQDLLEQNCGFRPNVYAYPYGMVSEESVPILKELGFRALLTCREKPNYITKNPECLYSLNRYNRPSGVSTEQFMKKILNENT